MAYDPKDHLIRVNGGKQYLPVMNRLVWFRERYPAYGIDTEPVKIDTDKGVAVFHARITDDKGRLVSSGTKMETARNFGDFVEKAETGAIGRALGALGLGTEFALEFDEGERLVDSPGQAGSAGGDDKPQAGGGFNCEECGVELTAGQQTLSLNKFKRSLCPAHQVGAKTEVAGAKTEAEETGELMSDTRRGELFATAAKCNWTKDDIHSYTKGQYGIEHVPELTELQAKMVIRYMKTRPFEAEKQAEFVQEKGKITLVQIKRITNAVKNKAVTESEIINQMGVMGYDNLGGGLEGSLGQMTERHATDLMSWIMETAAARKSAAARSKASG